MGTNFLVVKPLQVSEALTMCAWYAVLQTEADLACMRPYGLVVVRNGGTGDQTQGVTHNKQTLPSELQP